MNALRALLADRRRSQQGSVLSAVLIITAFLAIIAGALMTELSTNFLLSNNLVNRVATQATVNSAVELAINQIQRAPLNGPCPSLASTPTLNSQTAVVSYSSCYPTVDRRSQQFVPVAASSQFRTDGTHAQLPGLNDYVVGDAGGRVFDYPFGQSAPRWTLALGGSVTGTPLVMPDPNNGGEFLDLIPTSSPTCAPSSFCVNVQSDDGSFRPPSQQCTMGYNAPVVTQPAVGRNYTNIAYSADTSGTLIAYNPTNSGGGVCDDDATPTAAGGPIVAGPLVFACRSGCGGKADEVYVVTSTGSSSQLVHYRYANTTLSRVATLQLPSGSAAGLAADGTSLPARLAITFGGGGVAVVQIDTFGNMALAPGVGLPTGISGAPYWCHCPGSPGLIGVGGRNGSLYVLNPNLSTYATYAGGPAINTAPAADAAGNWYFAADNGSLYEVQKLGGGTTMSLATSFGSAGGPIRSSPLLGSCQAGICLYLGSLDARAYLVSLDARHAVLNACISAAPPNCSGVNPRLWTQIEVGARNAPQTVHVQGWSYYST